MPPLNLWYSSWGWECIPADTGGEGKHYCRRKLYKPHTGFVYLFKTDLKFSLISDWPTLASQHVCLLFWWCCHKKKSEIIRWDYSLIPQIIIWHTFMVKHCLLGRTTYFWLKPNAIYWHKYLTPAVKHGGGGVMVWGGFTTTGNGHLVVTESCKLLWMPSTSILLLKLLSHEVCLVFRSTAQKKKNTKLKFPLPVTCLLL